MKALWENVLKKKPHKRLLVFLKSMPFFKDFSEKELSRISECFHKRIYKEGEVIFKQKDLGIGMYIILEGHVEILTNQLFSSLNKKESLILEKKDFFGEIALLEPDSLRTAMARAQSNTKLIGLFRHDLEDLRTRHPFIASKFILKLSQVLAKRLRVLVSKVEEFQTHLEKFQDEKKHES